MLSLSVKHRGAVAPRALFAGILAAALVFSAALVACDVLKAEVREAARSSVESGMSGAAVLPIDSVLSITTSKDTRKRDSEGRVSGTLELETREYVYTSIGGGSHVLQAS